MDDRTPLTELDRVCTLLACVGVRRLDAHRRLGIGDRTLRERLKRYGIKGYSKVEPTPQLCREASSLIDQLDDLLLDAIRLGGG